MYTKEIARMHCIIFDVIAQKQSEIITKIIFCNFVYFLDRFIVYKISIIRYTITNHTNYNGAVFLNYSK